jgi:hypothetical protein
VRTDRPTVHPFVITYKDEEAVHMPAIAAGVAAAAAAAAASKDCDKLMMSGLRSDRASPPT